ncbi:hypothetical protein [Campylobacter concisus]
MAWLADEDVKARNLNLDLVKFIRDSQNITPIMLLQDISVPSVLRGFTTLGLMILSLRHFCPEEFLFHAFSFVKCFWALNLS